MFILDYEKLEPGDIILTTEKSSTSYVVRAFTLSRFSHAILYVGNGSYIHSNMSGVHSDSINRLIFKNKHDVAVFRVRDSEYCFKACDFSRLQIGKEYSVKEAVKTRNPLRRDDVSDKQFCSRLVAQAYEYSGLKLVKNSAYCTPQELISESVFRLDGDGIVREATNEEIAHANSDNPLKIQASVTNNILKLCRDLTSVNIQSLEQLDSFVFSNPNFDAPISDVIKKSGYLTLWVEEINKNVWRYERELFLDVPLPINEKIELSIREKEGAESRLARYLPALVHYKNACINTNLEYARILFKLYVNLVKHTNRNLDAANYVFDKLSAES